MKNKRLILPLIALALFVVPVIRAQQPTPSPTPEQDVFDVLKKGLTKVQKQTREAKEIEPQIKALKQRQDEMQTQFDEAKERLHVVLTHQEEAIKRLNATVEKLEAQLKTLQPTTATTPSPAPVAPLPATEPTPARP